MLAVGFGGIPIRGVGPLFIISSSSLYYFPSLSFLAIRTTVLGVFFAGGGRLSFLRFE